jgi:hypothetical protein
MFTQETVILSASGVKAHQSETPPSVGLKAGAFADLGTLILTSQRLVYILKGGDSRGAAWALGGVFAAGAIEKKVSQAQLDEMTQYPGSYSIPLENITFAKSGSKWGTAYLSVGNNAAGLKPVYCFAFGDANQQWVDAINTAKARLGGNQNFASTETNLPLPPPPPDFQPPTCPICGGPLSYIAQYERWYCYRDQKYV